MHQKKISKETAWAVSIIVVCILAGCFLLHKMNTKQSDINILSDNGDMIVPLTLRLCGKPILMSMPGLPFPKR